MGLVEALRDYKQADADGTMVLASRQACDEAADEIERLREAIALAYGHLWHVNDEPAAPIPLYTSGTAATNARKALKETMTTTQRGDAINTVRLLMTPNARVQPPPECAERTEGTLPAPAGKAVGCNAPLGQEEPGC